MPAGIASFCPERLVQIREARGLTSVALSEMLGVSPATISQYEHRAQKPRQEALDALSRVLNVPASFFLSDASSIEISKLYFRSMSNVTKFARTRVQRRYELLLESINYLSEYVDFPALRLPDIDMPSDFHRIDEFVIESAAAQTRQFWQLGTSPIADLVRTAESNGILVWRTQFDAETMDAFSEYRSPHPVIVLSSDKDNYFRSRFDLAHEIGHLVLHREIDSKALRKAPDFKLLEEQAHHFASALLLPADEFREELWDFSVDAFRSLKGRWKASIATMIMRSRKLGMVREEQEKRLWINLARRGWRKREPLDDSTPPEEPTLIKQTFKMLIENRIRSLDQISADLHLHSSDLISFANAAAEYFVFAHAKPELKIKKLGENVVQFSRKG